MKRKIQNNAEGYPFVFIPMAHAETVGITKGSVVDVTVEGNAIRIIPVAPTAKSELQGAGSTPSQGVTGNV